MLTSMLARCASAGTALMVVTVWGMSAPVPGARAATLETSGASSGVLAQGAGMGSRPSIQVRRLQRILERAGFDVGSPGVDGRFGPLTDAAVRRMQDTYGLAPDGIVGPKTRRVVALIGERLLRQRARNRSATPRARAPRQPAKPQPAPRGTTAAPPRSQRPTARSKATPAHRPDTTAPTLLAAIAVLVAAAALATTFAGGRRRRDGASLAAVPRDLYLEGHSRDENIGRFSGFAMATALPSGEQGDSAEERYLVDDPRRPAPVWVCRSEIRRSASELGAGEPVLGYVTAGNHAARENEQFIAIEDTCAQAGWELREIIRDEARERMSDRPGLTRALEEIAARRARGLVLAETRGVVGSVAELGSLLEWFRDAGAALVALDLALDTSTVHGRQSASTLIALAEWERDRAWSRTRSGSASVTRPESTPPKGRPTPSDGVAVVQRLNAMREAGMSLQAIADQLNNDGVPAPRGGDRWRPSAVHAALADARTTTGREQLPPIAHRERDE